MIIEKVQVLYINIIVILGFERIHTLMQIKVYMLCKIITTVKPIIITLQITF